MDGAKPRIAHNIISNNTTEVGNGGGIACRNDACPKIIYNVIWGNKAGLADVHRTRSGNGGGISCFAGATPVINNNLMANNHAGGGSDGGAVYCEYDSSPQVHFNYLLGNRADDDGAGIESMKGSHPQIHGNFIAGNYGGGGGSGICVSDDGLAAITGNVVIRNHGVRKAGGLACNNAWMLLKDNLIVDNTSPWPNDVLYYNEDRPYLTPPVIASNIIGNNANTRFDSTSGRASRRVNYFHGGYPGSANIPSPADFEEEGLKLTVGGVTHDPQSFVTVVSVMGGQVDENALSGRVVRIGSVWSLVKSHTSHEVIFVVVY